ncbi:MAG: N-acetyltransferase [Xanthobacteraceae bacterium]|nr:N-acetyltransferase [Xanthobacteraceae bacterium]
MPISSNDTESQGVTDTVRNNTTLHRFELDADGATSFASYRLADGVVVITHVETPDQLRGRGIASKLVDGALQIIRADGHKVIGQCSFARAYLARHSEFSDLLA